MLLLQINHVYKLGCFQRSLKFSVALVTSYSIYWHYDQHQPDDIVISPSLSGANIFTTLSLSCANNVT